MAYIILLDVVYVLALLILKKICKSHAILRAENLVHFFIIKKIYMTIEAMKNLVILASKKCFHNKILEPVIFFRFGSATLKFRVAYIF